MDLLAIQVEDGAVVDDRGKREEHSGGTSGKIEMGAKIVRCPAQCQRGVFRGRKSRVFVVKEGQTVPPSRIIKAGGNPVDAGQVARGLIFPRIGDRDQRLWNVCGAGRNRRPVRHTIVVL